MFRRRKLDADMEEELRSHLEMAVELNQRRGMNAEQAQKQALMDLGGVEQTKQICYDQSTLPLIDTALQDLRFGFRMLRRSPGFATVTVLCLTLGIGANAAVFSWIEGILFRPYPLVAHQERLLALSGTARGESGATALSWPDFIDLQKNSTLFDTVFVTKITGTTLSIGERAEVTTGSIVSANYFAALGIHPILGRGFEPGEDEGSNSHPVTVISYQSWNGRFHGDPQIIGKTQRFNNVLHTIIGVAPEGFYGTFVGWSMNFWVPASMEETFESGGYKLEDRGARWIEAYARLKPGVTRMQAQEETSAISRRLEIDYPATNRGRSMRLWPLWQTPFNNAGTLRPTLEMMLVVVVFVLLIACANVGNLLLVRSFARRHEMTVRLAIGAGPGRLLQQLFTEGLILSGFGAAGGLLVALWCRHALVLLLPARGGLTMHLAGEIDSRVLALSAGVGLVSILVMGLVPALQIRKMDLASALKSEMSGVLGGYGKSWLRSSLVVVQVSLSFVLLVGGVLLLQSLHKLRTTSPGFSTDGVLETAVPLVAAGYDVPRAKNFQEELIDLVRALPGVESAAFARVTPLGYGSYSSTPIEVAGYQPPPDELPAVQYNQVGPNYFVTLGIPLRSGREFTRSDDEKSPSVAIVNQTMASRYWPDLDPVGQRFRLKSLWVQVVGVAADSRYESMRETPTPFFYVPLRQDFARLPGLNIRTSLLPQTMAAALAREVRRLDGNLALYEMITLQEQVDRSTSPQKVAVTLVGILGGLALLLAAIGLYGVMSHTVSESSREMGLRTALGASASDLFRLVLSRGLALTAGGIALGIAASLGLTRLLGYLLFNVSPHDPLAFGSAIVVLTIVSFGACFLPAWRAMHVDPMSSLRHE